MSAELLALQGYLRAAVAIAAHPCATEEHGEALAEAVIHLAAVRSLRRFDDAPDINELLGNAPVARRARPWRLRRVAWITC